MIQKKKSTSYGATQEGRQSLKDPPLSTTIRTRQE